MTRLKEHRSCGITRVNIESCVIVKLVKGPPPNRLLLQNRLNLLWQP